MKLEQVNPKISVIVPVWNGERDIGRLLTRLGEQTADPTLFEVIVVDNGSNDQTRPVVEQFEWVTLLSEPKPGSYRARNRAVASAKAPLLLFTDADCTPETDWIARALALGEAHPTALVGGKVTLYREGKSGKFSARYDELTGFNQDWNINRNRMCVTANWLCSKDVLTTVGGFNAEFLSGGDAECSRRISDAGYPLVYADDLVVNHPTRASLGALIKKRRRVIGGRWQKLGEGRSFWRLSKLLLAESVNHLRWIKGGDYPWSEKLGVAAVTGTMYLTSQLELIRVALGFEPYRS